MYVHAGRSCARPNMGFFQQLIRFEKEVLGTNTVLMKDYPLDGGRVVRVPDIYKTEFPDLFEIEIKNQLRNSDFASKAVRSSETRMTCKVKNRTQAMPRQKLQNLKVTIDTV